MLIVLMSFPNFQVFFCKVIGITASLGVGDARGNDSAVYFVLKKCANLDARQIAVVKRNKEELAKYVHEPTEGI